MKFIRTGSADSIAALLAGNASRMARPKFRFQGRANGRVATNAAVCGLLLFVGLTLIFLTGCGGGSSSSSSTVTTSGTAEVVAITAPTTTLSTANGKPFASPLTATVTTNGVRTGGEIVTFTAPASGASGTFANGTTTETDVTNDNGIATSSTFTANGTAGPFTVTATVTGAATPASLSLVITAATSYAFYMSGMDINSSYYALAGSIAVDPTTGNVLGGEQDYNDGFGGINSPEPKGDTITGGILTVDATTGQGTLTLNTSDTNLNPNGTTPGVEVFAVQFVNFGHALIMQFDGFATSSGSMDVQNLATPPALGAGNYAFTFSGEDQGGSAVDYGGIFLASSTSLTNGIVDVNDGGTGVATTNTAFTGTFSTPDAFGRGTITGVKILGNSLKLNYYIVGPEVLRIIDVDTGSSSGLTGGPMIGSAFGQGTTAGTFSNASLGASVFTVQGNLVDTFDALGQFTTDSTVSPGTFAGDGDVDEPNYGLISASGSKAISGTYTVGSNGYGNFTIKANINTGIALEDVSILGIYLTDPTLNLEDPNNSVGGGGALVADMDAGTSTFDPLPGGTGVMIPQTDTSTADFNGNYAAGWQNFDSGVEFDMISQGTMAASSTLSLTGDVSDPNFILGTPDPTSSGDTFIGTPLADATYPGRYTMFGVNALVPVIDGVTVPTLTKFDMVLYQASATQLFWLDHDSTLATVSLGPIEQQGSLTGLPAARKATSKTRAKK